MKEFCFDTRKYNFKDVIQESFQTSDLESLSCGSNEDHLNTKYHEIYFNGIPHLDILYKKFIKEYIQELFDYEILFESGPMIRIHYRNKKSVSDFHIDSNYSSLPKDIFEKYKKFKVFDLYKNEINFWMPLTDAYSTNSLWVQSEYGKEEYNPINASYGKLIQFDGANLMHGTKINNTNITRVSLDFRIISKKIYDDFEEEVDGKCPEIIDRLRRYYNQNKKIMYH